MNIRACSKTTSHFRISSLGCLWLIFNRKILKIAQLLLRFCSIGSTKSNHKSEPEECKLIFEQALKLFAVILIFSVFYSCAPKQAVRPEEPAGVLPPVEEAKLPEIIPETETREIKKRIEKPVVQEKAQINEQYVMLNFENADIETVVSTIGEMLKINYILAPGLSGKITIQSNNKVPLSELFSTFQTVLEFNGFTAVKDGNFYRIVPIDTAKQQSVPIESGKSPVASKDSGFITQKIPLEYVKADDVAAIVRNLMPRGTDIVVYEPSNILIITSPPSGIVKLLKLLEFIDIPSAERDSIRTFVYNVKNGEAEKLADILKKIYGDKETTKKRTSQSKPFSPGQPARSKKSKRLKTKQSRALPTSATIQKGFAGEIQGEIIIEAYKDINALIIKTTPRGYISLLETIKKLDVQPKQVLIEVLIAEITLDDETNLGIEWLLKGRAGDLNMVGGYTQGNIKYDSSLKELAVAATDSILAYPTEAFVNIFDPKKFNMLISAAASTDRINVIASPHILALDNKEAKIEIADEVPVATSIYQPTTSIDYSTSQVEFKSVGTILTVTPYINEKKQVTLKLTQEVSELGTTVKIGGMDYQGFKTRKATTTAIVQDGHTLVIGGIITEKKQKTRTGIPFLSKIPILGYFFGSTTDTVGRKELILMVTPHVVGNPEEADELTKEFEDKVKEIKKKLKMKEEDRKTNKKKEENIKTKEVNET